MAIGKTNAGGGTSLNFDVKRYATEAELLAAAPKENTIGIISTTEMTGWIIDVNEPENLTEGMVWISVGTSSSVEFNALRKNGIQVYPLSAKQMVDGALVSVDAMSYQNGEWVEWVTYLYNNGDQCTDITGGWTAKSWPLWSHNSCILPSLTLNDANMVITQSSTSTATVSTGASITIEDIDLTGKKTIELEMESVVFSGSGGSPTPNWQVVLFAQERSADACGGVATSSFSKTVAGTFDDVKLTLDVAGLQGKYCVGINTYLYCSNKNGSVVATVNKVRCR